MRLGYESGEANGITMIYGLGLAIASLGNILAGKPIKMAYLIVFGLVFLGSLIMLLIDRAACMNQPATT
jgi:hypothetical protein